MGMLGKLEGRKSPTPRDRILDNRFNIKLEFEGTIPEDSYLFTGASVERIETGKITTLYNLSDRYIEGRVDERWLMNKVRDLTLVKLRPSRKPPKINEKVIIPASSVRGAIRSRIEYKLSPKYSCYSVEDRRPKMREFYKRHVMVWGEDVIKPRGSCNVKEVCPVCDLFGIAGLASRANFSDMVMYKGDLRPLDLGITAIAPSSKFKLEVTCLNADYLDIGLILLGFEIFTGSPVLMCAYKYRFHPKLNGMPYKGKYVFGKVKFALTSFEEIFTDKLRGLTLDQLKSKAREELDKLGQDIYIEKGCDI